MIPSVMPAAQPDPFRRFASPGAGGCARHLTGMNASLEKLSGPGGGMVQCLARSVVDTLVGAECYGSVLISCSVEPAARNRRAAPTLPRQIRTVPARLSAGR